jgi:hemolysin III
MWQRLRNVFTFEPMASLPEWIDAGEETANYLTHLPGAIASVIALVFLMIRAIGLGDIYHIISFFVFGASLVNLYTISTCYHYSRTEKFKRVLRYGDHVSIYCLIAGSYTPFCMVTMRNGIGWIILGGIWGIAALGIFLKILKFDGFFKFTVVSYVGMGWFIVFATKDMITEMSMPALYWLAFGGLMYTFGTFFFSKDEKVPYFHAIWHLYVLGGSARHFVAIYG